MTKSQNTKNEQQKDLCITVEKQVWESTLNRSMVLETENAQLKELLKEYKEMLKKSITYQCMDRANHYIKKIENDIYEPTLAKINEVLR